MPTVGESWTYQNPHPALAECRLYIPWNPYNYGGIRFEGRTYVASRLMWIMARGPIPEGMHVLHRCDVPGCIRPSHLFLGTHADNMRDKAEKNRQRAKYQRRKEPGTPRPPRREEAE